MTDATPSSAPREPSGSDVPLVRRTWARRSRSLPGVLVGFVVGGPLIVASLPLLAVADLVRGRRILPTVRLALFALWYLAWEVVAIVGSAALWVATGGGVAMTTAWSQRAHARFQAAWVASLLDRGRRLLALELDIAGAEVLGHAPGDGPLIVLCRHTSMVDTLVPAHLLVEQGYRVRYVLKDDLLWDPALDIFGNRLPNYFIDRTSPDMASELEAIERLAATAGPEDALVIFPEGTRWSARKATAALERLRATDPDGAARAERLTSVLPPRPAGTLALLAGRPDADVIVVSHTGLEGLAGPKDALRLLPLRRPMQIELRRIDRSEVPTDDEGRRAWLLDRWDEVDAWVAAHRRR